MRRLRTRTGHVVLSVGLLAWLLGLVAAQVHDLRAIHVQCDQHGQIVELSLSAGPYAHADAPSQDRVRGSNLEPERDHGCVLLGAVLFTGPTLSGMVPVATRERVERVTPPRQRAARGPPLVYAPKTSPPLLG
jgi:hypothetical protein